GRTGARHWQPDPFRWFQGAHGRELVQQRVVVERSYYRTTTHRKERKDRKGTIRLAAFAGSPLVERRTGTPEPRTTNAARRTTNDERRLSLDRNNSDVIDPNRPAYLMARSFG